MWPSHQASRVPARGTRVGAAPKQQAAPRGGRPIRRSRLSLVNSLTGAGRPSPSDLPRCCPVRAGCAVVHSEGSLARAWKLRDWKHQSWHSYVPVHQATAFSGLGEARPERTTERWRHQLPDRRSGPQGPCPGAFPLSSIGLSTAGSVPPQRTAGVVACSEPAGRTEVGSVAPPWPHAAGNGVVRTDWQTTPRHGNDRGGACSSPEAQPRIAASHDLPGFHHLSASERDIQDRLAVLWSPMPSHQIPVVSNRLGR